MGSKKRDILPVGKKFLEEKKKKKSKKRDCEFEERLSDEINKETGKRKTIVK